MSAADVPRLLRGMAQRASLMRRNYIDACDQGEMLIRQRDEARAEVDRLKAKLEKAYTLIGEHVLRDIGIEPPAPEPPPCPRCGGANREHYVDTGSPGRPVRCVRLESPEAAEAASPKPLRVFRVGDAAPDSSVRVRDSHGGFTWETPLVPSELWGNEYGQWMPWERLLRDYGPLTEIPTSPEAGA